MQLMEDESHLSVSYSEGDKLVRKSYCLMSENGCCNLKCTKQRTKLDTTKADTVLHIRMFQNKNAMMLQGKRLFYHMKQISLCSRASLGLSLTVQENDCNFDTRSGMIEELPETGFTISTNTEYILKDTQYTPSSLAIKIVSGSMKELPIIPDVSDRTFQLYTAGFKTVCCNASNTPSLVMLSWYGPGNIPLYDVEDTVTDIKMFDFVNWTKYGMEPVAENSVQFKGHKPCHEFLYVRSIRGNSCFVISLYAFLDIKDLGDCKRKTDTVHWLRRNRGKWMDNFKENIAANLEFIVDKTVNPTRTAEEEMTSLQYSQAIANISKSISNVVLRSSCEQFRRKCNQLLEIQDDGFVKQALSKRLWNITKSFGIFRPTDMESEESIAETNLILDDTSLLEYRSSKTNNERDEGLLVHEDDLNGLNWLPDQAENDGNIQHPKTAYSKNTHVLESLENTLDGKVSYAYDKAQADLENYPWTNNVHTLKEDLDMNLHIAQSMKENESSNDFHKVIGSAKDIWNCVEEGNEMGKYSQIEEQSKLELSKDIKSMNLSDEQQQAEYKTNAATDEWSPSITDSQQDPGFCKFGPVEKLPSPSVTLKVSKDTKMRSSDDWLDDALLELKDWFSDE
ncbi:uncharacterized protein LOC125651422 isoform X2 [Ostrea edulis]|nr:uncharacterized protein LOC125651422 isoform X2 [Ostrea edulis]